MDENEFNEEEHEEEGINLEDEDEDYVEVDF